MSLNLWIDDVREPPTDDWDWVTTSNAAIALLRELKGVISFDSVSFDHDLGGDDTTRPVVIWMIQNDVRFKNYHVHSANPVGRDWLEGMINRYLM